MSYRHPGGDAERALKLLSRLPGQIAAVWYSDDEVFHERIMIWRVDALTWYVLTPDRDLCAENFSGTSDNGPVSFKLEGGDFKYFSRLGQPVYRFDGYPSNEEFKEYVETALKELGILGKADMGWRPQKIFDMDGAEHEATAFLGRLLVPRRIRGGDQGRLELPTETHVADVGPGVAQAPDGSLWVAVHPTLDFKLGWEAVDSLNKGVKLDDIHCAVPGPRGWTIFKLVGAVQAPAVVDDLKSALKRSLDLGKVEPSAESKIADPKEEVGGDGPEETDDARTLPVEYDEQGERYKPWRDVCKEVREYSYPDWVHEGPQSCLHLIKHMQKNGPRSCGSKFGAGSRASRTMTGSCTR